MNNKFKAQSLNRKSYRKFALSCFSVTCFKHVGLLWPISALDGKQVHDYVTYVLTSYDLCSRHVAYVFVMWLMFSSCDLCFRHVTYVFVMWPMFSSCGLCSRRVTYVLVIWHIVLVMWPIVLVTWPTWQWSRGRWDRRWCEEAQPHTELFRSARKSTPTAAGPARRLHYYGRWLSSYAIWESENKHHGNWVRPLHC